MGWRWGKLGEAGRKEHRRVGEEAKGRWEKGMLMGSEIQGGWRGRRREEGSERVLGKG